MKILDDIGERFLGDTKDYKSEKRQLCFDDILLVPRYSELESRKDPDISSCLGGIIKNIYEIASCLLDVGCNVICIDVAHGDHKKVYQALQILNGLKGRYSFV